MAMKIGIIECGPVPEALRGRHVSYPAMFEAQLGALLPAASFETISVVHGEALPAVGAQDAWLLTGSRHGVYDDLPWIATLKDFIREAAIVKRPMVGVCFRHQIIAEALGGKVEKASQGWRIGMKPYATRIDGDSRSVTMPAFHQDQSWCSRPIQRSWRRARPVPMRPCAIRQRRYYRCSSIRNSARPIWPT